MNTQSITNIPDLIKNANDHGLVISCKQDKLIVHSSTRKTIPPELLAALKENKTELLDYLQRYNTQPSLSSNLNPQERPLQIPLSFSQERLWFIDKVRGSVSYHMPLIFKIKGSVDSKALSAAFKTIVERHEILRTVYSEHEGVGFQQVITADHWKIANQDFQEAVSEQDILDQLKQEITSPFNLAKDYMLRVKLVKRKADEYFLLIVIHHIAADGASFSVLLDEFTQLYLAQTKGQAINLSPLPIQYADYAIWQRKQFTNERLDTQLSYWKKQLQGVPPLNLPTDFKRPDIQSTAGAAYIYKLNPALSHALKAFSKQQQVTNFMTLLAALKVLLYRYTAQEDICVGTVISNRKEGQLNSLIGFFVNTLAIRSHLADDLSFTDLIEQVKATTLEAHRHQEVSFAKVVDQIEKVRDKSRNPVFQVMFGLLDQPMIEEGTLGDLSISNLDIASETSKIDLAFNVTMGDQISIHIEYCTDLFTASRIESIAIHYQTLLKSIVEEQTKPISRLNLLTEVEKNRQLFVLNPKTVETPTQTILDLFRKQVKNAAEQPAVVLHHEVLTYQELDQRSSLLAAHLQQQGVQPDTIVGLYIHRSIDMIVGVLGILKAGAAYLPLDPNYPKDRIDYMLRDSAVGIIVSHSSTAGLSSSDNYRRVLIGKLTDNVTIDFDQEQASPALDHMAYVIYTSGSSGQPKGVMVEHRGFVNMLLDHIERFGITADDKLLQFSSLSFDISSCEIFMSLCTGAALVLIDKATINQTDLFINYLREQNVSVTNLPPSFIDTVDLSELSFLRVIISGGESPNLAKALETTRFGRYFNAYGPTECSVCVSAYEVKPEDHNRQHIPIGQPIHNTQFYLLDRNQELTPEGMIGELYIGGIQVARGYLNRPELTQEKFIDHPFDSSPNSKLYKTGDLARWLPCGNLEYLGRADTQVKIRGHRIELGEIEAVLSQSPMIKQVAVLAQQEENSSTKRLVAYLIPLKDYSKEAVVAYLQSHLPEFMTPSFFLELDKMPISPNGKINRQALSALKINPKNTRNYKAPQSPTEQKLCTIWQSLLGVDKVGVDENFFELGGHSLLATRVVSAIRKELKSEIEVKDLFANPTVAMLAQVVNHSSSTPGARPDLIKQSRTTHIPLSYAQERLWFIDKLQGSLIYHMPLTLRLDGQLNQTALEKALQQIINRHEVLRTVFREEEGVAYQEVLAEDLWKMSYIDYTEAPQANNLEALSQDFIQKAFDLSKDHMLRALLIKRSEEHYRLLIIMHHIASDGWSMPILLKELSTLYHAFSKGIDHGLAPLTLQYADYSIWLRGYLSEDLLEQKLKYWENQLQGLSPLQLPLDFPRPAIQTTQGANFTFLIPKNLSRQLLAVARQKESSMFMTLLTAFKILLYKYTGQDDICVGTGIANRRQVEIEPLIGFFVNMIALRSAINNQQSFFDLLQEVRHTTLDAYAHQNVPFEKVVDRVEKVRDKSRNPIFQTMFVMQNNEKIDKIDFAGMEVNLEDLEYKISKFDLMFTATESDEALFISVEYNTDLFRSESIERMARHYKNLLGSIVEQPEHSIDQLPFLGDDEIQQLQSYANLTKTAFPETQTIPGLFQEQVARHPDQVALLFQEQTFTYREIDSQSNQLAHYLQDHYQIQSGDLIAIMLDHSEWSIMALLAVLKLDATYIPIDHTNPERRVSYILEDSEAKLLIDEKEIQKFKGLQSDIDHQSLSIVRYVNPVLTVIYTSGSTSLPKGVKVPHHGMINRLYWMWNTYPFQQDEVCCIKTSIGFGDHVWEIFGPLLQGVKLVIFNKMMLLDLPTFINHLHQHQISRLVAVPSLLREIIQSKEQAQQKLSAIKYWSCSGEALPAELVEKFYQTFDRTSILFNIYGSTEVTADASWYDCSTWPLPAPTETNSEQAPQPVPIGRPITNVQAYVLNQDHQLTPPGIVGELCIGGVGLALGYLNRPELTREKFIEHPFSEYPEEKLFKTGDLAKWLPDGNLLFMGRKDDQVKIRGYRIELGEIEAVLKKAPSVEQAIVLAKADPNGDNRLVAYLLINGVFDKEAITDWLHLHLPNYMVPGILIELSELPLNISGKIDKKALPDPNEILSSNKEIMAPRNEREKKMLEIWKEILGISSIGIDDHFFELGGHSLLVVRLISRINAAFSTELPVSILFEHPTVKTLQRKIDTYEKEHHKILVTLNQTGDRRPIFVTPGAAGNVFTYYELAKQLGEDQPFYAFEALGTDGYTPPLESVEEMAREYIREMQTIQAEGPYIIGGFSFGANVALEMAFQLRQQGQTLERLVILDAIAPLGYTDPDAEQPKYEEMLIGIKDILGTIFGLDIPFAIEELRHQPKEEQLKRVYKQIKKVGIDLSLNQFRGLTDVYIVSTACIYEPSTDDPLDIPILLYKTPEILDIATGYIKTLLEQEDSGWQAFTSQPVMKHQVPGTHLTFLNPPHVTHVAAHLRAQLSKK